MQTDTNASVAAQDVLNEMSAGEYHPIEFLTALADEFDGAAIADHFAGQPDDPDGAAPSRALADRLRAIAAEYRHTGVLT